MVRRVVNGLALAVADPPLALLLYLGFFFQAEDGIRDVAVTGVQTCALPICSGGGTGPPPNACGAEPHLVRVPMANTNAVRTICCFGRQVPRSGGRSPHTRPPPKDRKSVV